MRTLQMPPVLRLPLEDAEAKIRSTTWALRFDVQQVPARGPFPPAGTVVAQVPAIGGRVLPTTKVRLMVASDQGHIQGTRAPETTRNVEKP